MIASKIYYKIIELKQAVKFVKFRLFNRKKYALIKKNKKFKNLHLGKRCFILGNGPSLKEHDLSILANEYVFTVNQIMRHPDFQKLKTNYHFWADPIFFDINEDNPEDIELLNVMKSINTMDNKPQCFFPIEQMDFVERFKLNYSLNVNYFRIKLPFYNKYKKKIDFTKNVPGFGTVVQWAIIMAIYMGFKEIYLLGCDTTGIVVNIKSLLKENDETDYSYKITKNEKIRMEKAFNKQSIEEYAQSFWYTLLCYRNLYSYCKSSEIKLANCSVKTVIDTIPKVDFRKVIENEQIIIK